MLRDGANGGAQRGAHGGAQRGAHGGAQRGAQGGAQRGASGGTQRAASHATGRAERRSAPVEEEEVSQYELDRLENIRQNERHMVSFGLSDVLPVRPPQSSTTVIKLNMILRNGSFGGECPGWEYSSVYGGYLQKWIRRQSTHLHGLLDDMNVYSSNGLFRRRELADPIEAINWSDMTGMAPARLGVAVHHLLQANSQRCFQTPDLRRIKLYIFIDAKQDRLDPLERGRMTYCRGDAQAFFGKGLYVSYFDEGDFTVLAGVNFDLTKNYSRRAATAESAPGFYFHDVADSMMSRCYDLVDLASLMVRNPSRAVAAAGNEEDDEDR
jgi:hypothetical protein